MSERERFEEWLLGRDYHRSQLDAKNGVYRDPVVQVQWNVWQARARIAEQEKAEALRDLLPDHDAGLSLEHNQHRNVYDTAEQWIEDHDGWCEWESDEAKQRAIETDSIWTLQWYPDTPIGFYAVAAPTLADLLRFAANDEQENQDEER